MTWALVDVDNTLRLAVEYTKTVGYATVDITVTKIEARCLLWTDSQGRPYSLQVWLNGGLDFVDEQSGSSIGRLGAKGTKFDYSNPLSKVLSEPFTYSIDRDAYDSTATWYIVGEYSVRVWAGATIVDSLTGAALLTVTESVPAHESYTLSYNANGGSGAPASQTKLFNLPLTISSTVPTRTNYVFSEWNTQQNGLGTTYRPGGSYTENANKTLYAIWLPPNTVTFNANGGTGGPSAITKKYGTSVTIPSTKPTRTNYVFWKWNTKSDGTGTSYQAGDTYSANSDLNLYAQWHAPHNVSYDANGGTGAPAAQVKIYGQNLTLSTAIPTRAGWKFTGWNTTPSGSGGTSYSPGATYGSEADLKLYARWDRWVTGVSITDLTVKRVADGSSTSESDEGTYAYVTASFNVSGAAAASMTVSMTYTKDGTSVAAPVTLSQSTFTKAAADGDASVPFTLTGRASGLVTDSKYTFAMTVTTSNTSATQTIADQTRSSVLPAAFYTIDVFHGGHGIAFGMPATRAAFEVGPSMQAYFWDVLNAYGKRLTTVGGRVVDYPIYGDGHARLFSNGIAFKDPYNNSTSNGNSDYGWIRMIEETANSGQLEIATGDDGNEPIYVRQYNTSNNVAREAILLGTDGNTNFPGTIKQNGTAVSLNGHTHNYLEPVGNTGNNNTNHATGIKNYFDANKSTIPREKLINFLSFTGNNGAQAMGYFIRNYDSNPYGGFFVAHYNTPWYVGIADGTYTQWELSKVGHTHNYAGSSSAGGSANSAKMLDGFNNRSGSQGWGNQTGTFIFGMDDTTGGSIAFRRDNPSGGQLSMILDGTVYVDEGRYSVLNTNNYSSYALPKSGGTLSGNLLINSVAGSWTEGVRINRAPSGWCGVILGGDNGSTSGKQDYLWWIGSGPTATYSRKLFVQHYGSAGNTYFFAESGADSGPVGLHVGGRMQFRAVLYDNNSGTNGAVPLSQYSSDFNHMRVYYRQSTTAGSRLKSVDIYSPYGKGFMLDTTVMNSSTSYHNIKRMVAWSNEIAIDSGMIYRQIIPSGGIDTDNSIYVVRVECWNE